MNSYDKIQNTVAVFGVPRSGTSWLGQILNSSPKVAYRYQPLFSYEFNEKIDEKSTKQDIQNFYRDLLEAKSDFVLQKTNVSGNTEVDFKKTNPETLVWKEVRYLNIIENLLKNSNTKVVLLIRHPCAIINSWAKAPKEFDKSWNLEEEWRLAAKKNEGKKENYFGYEKWKEATRLFLRLKEQYPNKIFLIRYEDIVRDPLSETTKFFDFTQISLEEQTKDFLRQSTSSNDNDPYGVFRKQPQPEKWKKELPLNIQKEILNDLSGSGLAKDLGY